MSDAEKKIQEAKQDPEKRKKKRKFLDPLILEMIKEYKSNIVASKKIYRRNNRNWIEVADQDSWDEDETV